MRLGRNPPKFARGGSRCTFALTSSFQRLVVSFYVCPELRFGAAVDLARIFSNTHAAFGTNKTNEATLCDFVFLVTTVCRGRILHSFNVIIGI